MNAEKFITEVLADLNPAAPRRLWVGVRLDLLT